MELRILGCGSSWGSANFKTGEAYNPFNPDHRTRPSALVTVGGKNILIDCAFEVIQQLNRAKIQDIDAVLITHHDRDHIAGITELLQIMVTRGYDIPVYTDKKTMDFLMGDFAGYLFRNYVYDGIDMRLIPYVLPSDESGTVVGVKSFTVAGVEVQAFAMPHGVTQTGEMRTCLGFRFGDMAYCSDVSEVSPLMLQALAGVRQLVINCLGYIKRPNHLSFDESIAAIQAINPEQAWLTHLAEEITHENIAPRLAALGLADKVSLAHDNRRLILPANINYTLDKVTAVAGEQA